ncbi:hypothetical protein [Roseomonas chloroacetimidivorans]|uniref:hypothetical protein n=1 Tax=Roseomonas chloroacetimidivorans TaxID=1766656 RepID=UPI003C73CFBC
MSRPFRTPGEPVPRDPLVSVPVPKTSLPPRRGFLAAAAALVAAPAAAAEPPLLRHVHVTCSPLIPMSDGELPADEIAARAARHPDAEVMRLAQEVADMEAAFIASYQPPPVTLEEQEAREPEQDRLMHAISDHADLLAQMPVATLAGIVAKARAALAVAEHCPETGEVIARDYIQMLAFGALEDLVRIMECGQDEAKAMAEVDAHLETVRAAAVAS